MRWRPRSSFLIGLVLLAAVALVGVAYVGQHRDARSLEALSADSSLWHVAGIERELLRFTRAVTRAMAESLHDTPNPALADVPFRFEILWSRVLTTTTGPIGARVKLADSDGVVPRLMRLLEAHEARVMAFDPADHDGNEAMLAAFAEVERGVTELAALADRVEQDWTRGIHDAMLGSAEMIKGAGVLALLLSLLIGVTLHRQARLDAARLREIRAQAERAEAASLTRERFLTMVSHELRTPMNGVLGMIALLQASRLEQNQAFYARHAWRSGHIMLSVIEALLDMSDIRDGRLTLKRAEFALADLARAVETRLEPLGEPGAARICVDVPGDPAARFTGDVARIGQLTAQMVFHVIDTLGAQRCCCRFGLHQGTLEIVIRLSERERLRWPLETILDPASPGARSVASDASGPAVARALIASMGGTAAIAHPGEGTAELRIGLPSAAPVAGAAAPDGARRAEPETMGRAPGLPLGLPAASLRAAALRAEPDAMAGPRA
ncbi:MAG: histidine kinase dimerization/phospho-acceptor domain-containing protein [Thermohalobaculum sp.]|nr:histidine kinase dimerization/phospho-acceptor domain-containing protein [Thermohalobaculum sp.]